jgi:hypothetical protein
MAKGGLVRERRGSVPRSGAALTLYGRIRQRVISGLSEAALGVVTDGCAKDDYLVELRAAVHLIQRTVLAQAAARAYPREFRLGVSLKDFSSCLQLSL